MFEHRLAKLAAAAAFLLLIIGGTVNPTGSSLACPEPTLVCHGQLFPPMVGGVFYEHGHRLAAMTVGLLQIALSFSLSRRRKSLAKLGWIALGLVIAQGALGAITVKFNLPWFVSTGHLLLGMSYFATLIYIAFRTRRPPTVPDLETHRVAVEELGSARNWIAVACVAVFVQLLLGALVRHGGAALVCLGMPSCTMSGDWWPAAGVQHLHMIHRAWGVIVGIITITAAVQVLRAARSWSSLRVLMYYAPVLVIGQIVLGIFTVLTFRAVPIAVAHFAGATALWGLWMSAWFLTSTKIRRAVVTENRPASFARTTAVAR